MSSFELISLEKCENVQQIAGSSNGRTGAFEASNLGSIPSPAAFMECREITPNDWKNYREFRLAALKSPDACAFGGLYEKEVVRSEEEWRNLFNGSKPRFFYGCFDNEKIVSVAGVYFNQDNEEFLKEWILVGIYTKPEYRGKGLSSKTITAVLEKLVSKGVKKAVLYVNAKQEPAIKLYEKLGFKVVKTIKDQVLGDGKVYDELVMEKSLI